jgi:hypothetical protein
MVLYDAAYVTFVLVTRRSLAPLKGRLRGIREWRTYRASGRGDRRPVTLARIEGLRAALRRDRHWAGAGTTSGSPQRAQFGRWYAGRR